MFILSDSFSPFCLPCVARNHHLKNGKHIYDIIMSVYLIHAMVRICFVSALFSYG